MAYIVKVRGRVEVTGQSVPMLREWAEKHGHWCADDPLCKAALKLSLDLLDDEGWDGSKAWGLTHKGRSVLEVIPE